MNACDIMTSELDFVTPEQPVSRAAQIMRDAGVGIVPVVDDVENQRLVGLITDRDIAVRCTAHMHIPACDVRVHMTTDRLRTVGPNDEISGVIDLMKRAKVRRIPVVDEKNHLEGMISQADIATKLGPSEPFRVEKVLESVSTPAGVAPRGD